MVKSKFFVLRKDNADDFFSSINRKYSIEESETDPIHYEFYDTFDSRFLNSGRILVKYDKNVIIHRNDAERNNCFISLDSNMPSFCNDFPDSDFRNFLSGVVGDRAISKIASIYAERNQINVRNKEAKIVARIEILYIKNMFEIGARKEIEIVTIKGIRGYDKEFSSIVKIIGEIAEGLIRGNYWINVLGMLGVKPRKYSAKLDVKLSAADTSYHAVKLMLLHMLNVIMINEEGIKKNIDTEFLHDFRVSVRRTRSALTQLMGVFNDTIVQRFRTDFEFLQESTNIARDLDVYIITVNQFKELLPKELVVGLSPIIDYLICEKLREYRELTLLLASSRYKKIIHEWKLFLNSNDTDKYVGECGLEPLNRTANAFVFKSIKSVNKRYERLLERDEPENMHRLRIGCKKLRYIMEFFASLYPYSIYKKAVKSLKSLQDALGVYQDIQVQKNMLMDIFEKLKSKNKLNDVTPLSVGYIMRVLEDKQRVTASDFNVLYDKFNALINKKEFKEVIV